MKKLTTLLLVLIFILGLVSCKQQSNSAKQAAGSEAATQQSKETEHIITDESYVGSGEGNNGSITVEVTFESGSISSIQILEHSESPVISDTAIEQLPELIVKYQSIQIDTVSGATNTSKGIIQAVSDALTQSGVSIASFSEEVEMEKISYSDTSADVVVIGAGGTGMAAAIALKEAGANVILLEKQDIPGGATNLAATYYVNIGTEFQKEADMDISIEDFTEYLQKGTPELDGEMLELLMSRADNSMYWLIERGLDLTVPMSYYQVGVANGANLGLGITGVLTKEVEELDIDIRLHNKATEILMNGDKVAGVQVETENGVYTIETDYVIIATGGFASAPDKVAQWASKWEGSPSTSASGSTGDGLVMAQEAGASLTNLDCVRMNPSVYTDGKMSVSVSVCRAGGGIMVNMNGKRFIDDYITNYTVLSEATLEQPEGFCYVIFDQTVLDSSTRIQEFYAQDIFIEAETIDELAEKLGMPIDSLKETIEKYHTVFDTGVDEEFGRTLNIKSRLDMAPYYAVKCQPGLQVTLGGIAVDENMQVLRKDGSTITGLYAAGECADDGLFSTAPTTIALSFGTLAAEKILEQIK